MTSHDIFRFPRTLASFTRYVACPSAVQMCQLRHVKYGPPRLSKAAALLVCLFAKGSSLRGIYSRYRNSLTAVCVRMLTRHGMRITIQGPCQIRLQTFLSLLRL
jgi:hypothetical protein